MSTNTTVSNTLKMAARQLLLISSSRVHGHQYLECAADDINLLCRKNNVTTILFIPYALREYDDYLSKVKEAFSKWGYKVEGIHHNRNPAHAVRTAEAIFIGGGNTFQLLKALYDNNLIDIIRMRVLEEGIPYIGSSAGSNVATKSIHTTNDMPIVYPPTFEALNLIPFNINPHYLDPDPTSKHKGETREERILQYLKLSHARPVLALREGNSLSIEGNKATLKGIHQARLFIPGEEPKEYDSESDLSFLLNYV